MLTLALALTVPAHALSCLWGIDGATIEDGATVPSNAQLVVNHTYDEATTPGLVVLDADGKPVAAAVDAHYHYAVVRPEALEPGTYTLTSTDEQDTWWVVAFTVSDAEDTTPPEAPAILEASRESSQSEWGPEKGIRVELTEADEAGHFEYELATVADFSDAERVVSRWNSAYLGQGLCSSNPTSYDHADRYFVRARFVDVAGNASDWVQTDGPVGNALGCSTVSGAPVSLGVLLLAALGLRRR